MKNLFTNILLILTTWSFAQVGINTENPSQMLDVEGRIEISDDNSPPTDGAIRYNATEEEFEGYAGTQWNSFTSRGLGYPANAIPVYGSASYVSPNHGQSIRWWDYNDVDYGYILGPDEYILITHIIIQPGDYLGDDVDINETFHVSLTPYYNIGTSSGPLFNRNLSIFSNWTSNNIYSSDNTPLFILRPFEYLEFLNKFYSDRRVSVRIKGFLVSDLDFSN